MIKINLFKDRILVFAIIFSAIWHIFWLSAFTVVVVPKAKKAVKFSNVSFLGPILERGALSVNVEAAERTTSEKKYLASIGAQPVLREERPAHNEYVLPRFDIAYFGNEEELTALSIANIDTNKIEPGRNME